MFEQPSHAAEFALRLTDALRSIDWPAMGMPETTAARIGLHTGPVLRTFDPVMNKPAFYGTHVTRTARLEPIVRSGRRFLKLAADLESARELLADVGRGCSDHVWSLEEIAALADSN